MYANLGLIELVRIQLTSYKVLSSNSTADVSAYVFLPVPGYQIMLNSICNFLSKKTRETNIIFIVRALKERRLEKVNCLNESQYVEGLVSTLDQG